MGLAQDSGGSDPPAVPGDSSALSEMSLEGWGSPQEEKALVYPCWSSPRISPSVLPVPPRIPPGLHLRLPPSLEGVEGVSSWGALEEARGLLPSLHSQCCGTQKGIGGYLGNSLIPSHSSGGHSMPGQVGWCWGLTMMRQHRPYPHKLQ